MMRHSARTHSEKMEKGDKTHTSYQINVKILYHHPGAGTRHKRRETAEFRGGMDMERSNKNSFTKKRRFFRLDCRLDILAFNLIFVFI